MIVLTREDLKHSADLKEFIGKGNVVRFPATLIVAECGCFTITVETPFGKIESLAHVCGQHRDTKK